MSSGYDAPSAIYPTGDRFHSVPAVVINPDRVLAGFQVLRALTRAKRHRTFGLRGCASRQPDGEEETGDAIRSFH